ncbi:MAG: hypothetical protein GX889_08450 [Clostridiales bacterium]|nr:hypothetical protein [Clostridiales bacterium]
MKELFLYESHTGGFYIEEELKNNLYCEDCDDSDFYLGSFRTKEEALNLIRIHNEGDFEEFEDYVEGYLKNIY